LHKHATQQGYATQSEAEPETPNPHTGRETGLNNLSRGLGETAHRSPAGGTRRAVRARPTQGRVALAKGNAKLPKRPQDEGGPREANFILIYMPTNIGTKGRAEDTDLIKRIRMAYPQDPTACHLIKTTSHANPAYRAMAGFLYHIDDSRYRLYVPDDAGIIRDILAHHHDHPNACHPGQNRMERTLKQHFYWPGLHKDVSAYVRSCCHCQLHKSAAQPPAPQTTFPFPSQPFEEIALDWVGPLPVTPLGNDFLLNGTDRLTKFVVCIPCTQSMTKTQFAHALHHDLFCVHGSPRVIISDRDPRIDNDFIRQLETLQGISH
jgi:hypothetical protein